MLKTIELRFPSGDVKEVVAFNFFYPYLDEEAMEAYYETEEGAERLKRSQENGFWSMHMDRDLVEKDFTSYLPTSQYDDTVLNCLDWFNISEYALTWYQHDLVLQRPVIRLKFSNAELTENDILISEENENYVRKVLAEVEYQWRRAEEDKNRDGWDEAEDDE